VKRTIAVLNELEQDGVFLRYAIGGAMGAIFYTEPFLTFDLDVFVLLPSTAGGLLTFAGIYDALRARGYSEENECVTIEGVPVQFLPAYNSLVEEALNEAQESLYEDVPRVSCKVNISSPLLCKPDETRTASGCEFCANKQTSTWTFLPTS
jgi:hypothetical protein